MALEQGEYCEEHEYKSEFAFEFGTQPLATLKSNKSKYLDDFVPSSNVKIYGFLDQILMKEISVDGIFPLNADSVWINLKNCWVNRVNLPNT